MLFDNLKYAFLKYVNQKYQTQRAVQLLDKYVTCAKVLQDLKTKTNSSFAVKVTERSNCLFGESRFSDICTIMEVNDNLTDCVNIWKTSEAANLVFKWIFSVKHKLFHVSTLKI